MNRVEASRAFENQNIPEVIGTTGVAPMGSLVYWDTPSGWAYNPSAPATMSLSPGSRLGSYEVTAKIGQGGMGEV